MAKNDELNALAQRLFIILEGGLLPGGELTHPEQMQLRERVESLAPRGYHLVMLYGCGMVRLSVKAARTLEDVGTVVGSVVSHILASRRPVALEQTDNRPTASLDVQAALAAALAALDGMGKDWLDLALLRPWLDQWTRGTQDSAILALRRHGWTLVPTDRDPGEVIRAAAVTGPYGTRYHYLSR